MAMVGLVLLIALTNVVMLLMARKESLLLTAVGVVVGVPLAMLVARALTSSLYGVKPFNRLSYVLAVIGVTAVALGASAVPAGRAASIDPLRALRTE
jgi:ABC-type antimicrobial peptide transport system permease subunit